MHKFREIRERIGDLLVEETGSEYTIYKHRLGSLPDDQYPAIAIYVDDESAENTSGHAGYSRNAKVKIACFVRGNQADDILATGEQSVDEKLDEILSYVEDRLMLPGMTLSRALQHLRYEGLKVITNAQGEELMLIGIQQWNARYITDVGDV